MMNPNERAILEERAAELGVFLAKGSDDPMVQGRCFKEAWVMLFAMQLVDASAYALKLLEGLTTDEFAGGGDRPARDRLREVLMEVGSWYAYETQGLETGCHADVQRAVANNPM
jgi:hypothetical protein